MTTDDAVRMGMVPSEGIQSKLRRSPWKWSNLAKSSLHTVFAWTALLALLSSVPRVSSSQYEEDPCTGIGLSFNPQLEKYMTELYARMVREDSVAAEHDGVDRLEQIIATERLAILPSDDPHMLTFNTSSLGDIDNLTMAQVAVVTRDRLDACQPHLELSRRGQILPCENSPFHIPRLATFDVDTSLLVSSLGNGQFQVYAKRTHHIETASLVVFNGINTPALFSDSQSICSGVRSPRKKRGVAQDMYKNRAATVPSFEMATLRNEMLKIGSTRQKEGAHDRQSIAGSLVGLEHGQLARLEELRRKVPRLRSSVNEDVDGVNWKTSENKGRGVAKMHVKDSGIGLGKGSKHVPNKNKQETSERKEARFSARGQLPRHTRRLSSYYHKRRDSLTVTDPAFTTPDALLRDQRERRKRSISENEESETYTPEPNSCLVMPLPVMPLEHLQLRDMISPQILQLGMCAGECAPILPLNKYVPMHSYLISLLFSRSHNFSIPVPPPSCRPKRFQSFSVYLLEENNLVVERWNNARVIECHCVY